MPCMPRHFSDDEFGEVDIDGSLAASHSSVAEDVVMVKKGC